MLVLFSFNNNSKLLITATYKLININMYNKVLNITFLHIKLKKKQKLYKKASAKTLIKLILIKFELMSVLKPIECMCIWLKQ